MGRHARRNFPSTPRPPHYTLQSHCLATQTERFPVAKPAGEGLRIGSNIMQKIGLRQLPVLNFVVHSLLISDVMGEAQGCGSKESALQTDINARRGSECRFRAALAWPVSSNG